MVDAKGSSDKATSTPGPATGPVHSGTTNGLAIAALVTGIVAFLSGLVIVFGFIVGAAAIVLGIIALKKSQNMKGMSIAGIILGGIAALVNMIVTAIWIIALISFGIGGAALNEGINDANQSLSDYNADSKAKIEAAKDYKKGETARFGQFEVKINSVQRDYTNTDSFFGTPEAGKEFVLINLTVKNVGTESETISGFEIMMNDKGVSDTKAFLTVAPDFEGGKISPNASATGNIVYEVTKGSADLKLQYETSVYDLQGSDFKKLTYTLAI